MMGEEIRTERMFKVMEKKEIRLRMLARARLLAPDYRREAGAAIAARVLTLPVWDQAQTVLMYMALPTEPETSSLRESAVRAGKTVLLPRCLPDHKMEAVPWLPGSEMHPGAWGIPCPAGPAYPGVPDLCLIPCVSAAPGGIRLGHGGGYYDRYLTALTTVRLCLCFSALVSPELPAEDTDVRMDGILTENGLLEPSFLPVLFGNSPENGHSG